MKGVLAILLVASVAGATAHAEGRAMKPDATAHFDRGRALFMKGDYTQAMLEFERGRDLDPNPDFDYALGQVFVKLGDCKHAMLEYNAFLATDRSTEEVNYARESMALCRKRSQPAIQLERLPEQEPAPASTLATAEPAESFESPASARAPAPASAVDTDRAVVDRPRWYGDVPGGVLAGAGLVGLASGVTYLVLAERDVAAANSATTVARLQSQAATVDHDRTIGTVAAVAGGALAIGAVVRYTLVARSQHASAPAVSLAVDSHGAYAVWSGRF
jgi:tetratricopeptide (TPR) repeat protein